MGQDVLAAHIERLTGRTVEPAAVKRLPKDASARTYYRVTFQDGNAPATMIVMDLGPSMGTAADEVTSGPLPDEPPFLEIREYLESLGLPVPRLHGMDRASGLLLLEDFGDITLEKNVSSKTTDERLNLYEKAVQLLVDFQTKTRSNRNSSCIAFRRDFNKDLLVWELNHFREWMLEKRGIELSKTESNLLDTVFDRLASELVEMEQVLVHRDFQSRNIMVKHDNTLGLLDFQDALIGPRPYDLVALLRDSYVVLDEGELSRLMSLYLELCKKVGVEIQPERFNRDFVLVTLQRKLKDSGRFVFINEVKGNPSFLKYIPASMGYVRWALENAKYYSNLFMDLKVLLDDRLPKESGVKSMESSTPARKAEKGAPSL